MECVIANPRSGIFQHGHETHAINWLWPRRLRKTGQFHESRKNVYALCQLKSRLIRLGHTGCGDQDWNTIGLLVIGMFGPDPEVAEMKAMIAPEDHDGIIS